MLVCAEMRAYKLLQGGGGRHANVGELDAVVWTACGEAAAGGDEAETRAAPCPSAEAASSSAAVGEASEQQEAGDGGGGGATRGGSYVVLIQAFYGSQTLDAYVTGRLAEAERRRRPLAPGSVEFERMLLPLVAGVAGAIAHAHRRVSEQLTSLVDL